LCFFFSLLPTAIIYGDADKSLDLPGRKQATANKLYLLQATQKQFRRLSVQPGLRGSNDLRVEAKMTTFQLFFSRIGLRTYQHHCNTQLKGGKTFASPFVSGATKTTLKTNEMFRTDFFKNTIGRKQTFVRVFERKMGRPRLKFVTSLVVLPKVSQKQTWAQFVISSMKTEGYHFGDG